MFDCVILGAGAIGLSLAWELARKGLRVQIVDRGLPGKEASWAGAGMLPASVQSAGDHPFDQLAGLSSALHPEWSARLREATGIDNGYLQCGSIQLARDESSVRMLHSAAVVWKRRGVKADRLSWEELRELAPPLACFTAGANPQSRSWTAYYLPQEAQLRSPRHAQALSAACQLSGVDIAPNAEIVEVQTDGDRVTAVRSREREFAAAQFVVASGAWSAALLAPLGISLPVRPIRGQMALLHADQPLFKPLLNEGPRYLVPRADGRILVGSTEEDVGFDKGTTAEGIEGLLDFARGLVPATTRLPVEATWAGFRPGTPDGFPYLGLAPGLSNLHFATGHYRSGLHLSTGTAVVMRELLLGQTLSIDLQPFRVDRTAPHCGSLDIHDHEIVS